MGFSQRRTLINRFNLTKIRSVKVSEPLSSWKKAFTSRKIARLTLKSNEPLVRRRVLHAIFTHIKTLYVLDKDYVEVLAISLERCNSYFYSLRNKFQVSARLTTS
jgi:hypothetical protein